MGRLLPFVLPLLLVGCALGSADDPREVVEGGACLLAVDPTIDAWEALVGPIPARCDEWLDGYEVLEVTAGEMPSCDWTPVDGEKLAGCTYSHPRVIYILDDLSDDQRATIAVHEWTHALSACVYGDGASHTNATLWGPSGVVEMAAENAYLGPCL